MPKRSTSPSPSRAKRALPADDAAFWRSIKLYGVTVTAVAGVVALVFANAPSVDHPACADFDSLASLWRKLSSRRADDIAALYRCTAVYQQANELFVAGAFFVAYTFLKTFAIPVAFTLGILGGSTFPLWQSQLLTGVGEALGSSLCYLLSAAIAAPVLQKLAPAKLAMLRERAAQEREHMLLFNFFLRLTPFAPNWFINVASPVCGIPLTPFFVGSLFGTQLSLLFLALTGATLREAGESNFELGDEFLRNGVYLGLTMGVLQLVPIGIIALQKRQKASAAGGRPKANGHARAQNGHAPRRSPRLKEA